MPPSLDHSDQCFPPSELAEILCLNSLVVHHLRVIAHFTPVASPFISQSVLELVPHALAVICGLEHGRGGQGFHVVDVIDLSRRRKQ